MPNLQAMSAQLDAVRSRITSLPSFSSGRPGSKDKADAEAATLDKLADIVDLILRDLRSAEALSRTREEAIRRLPRESRFAAQQSVRDQAKDISELQEKARGLTDLLHDLLKRNGMLNPMQVGKELGKLIESFEKTLGGDAAKVAEMRQIAEQPTIGSLQQPGANATLHTLAPLIAFAYLGVKYLALKSRESRSHSA